MERVLEIIKQGAVALPKDRLKVRPVKEAALVHHVGSMFVSEQALLRVTVPTSTRARKGPVNTASPSIWVLSDAEGVSEENQTPSEHSICYE